MAVAQRRLSSSHSEGSLSVSSRLSDRRKEKLLLLKKREDLKDALTEKLRSRFAHGGLRGDDEVSVASAAIRDEVDKFADSATVTSANLGRLERRLQGRARAPAGDAASEVSGYSFAPSAMSRSRSMASMTGSRLMGGGGASGGGMMKKTYDWSKLDQYASYLHEQDCIRQHMGVKALQRKFRMDLDGQVAQKQHRRALEDEEDLRYHQNSMMELERWKEMERLREEEKQQKITREKEDRDAQLSFERKIKDEEMRKKKDEEASLVNKIVSEMEAEQKRFERKKEQTKKSMRKVYEENQKDQDRRNREEMEQREREAQAMKDYARAMDEQEEQRQQEMQQRLERQNELMSKLQANADNLKKGASDNDAQRARLQQEEMDRHFFEAEDLKQNRLKQLALENQAYLLKQMEEKDMRREDDRQLQNIQAQILARDTDEYNEIEKQKVINRRRHLVEHANDIKRQMAHKLKASQPVMTEAEIQMNKPLLKLVERTLENRDQHMGMQMMSDGEED